VKVLPYHPGRPVLIDALPAELKLGSIITDGISEWKVGAIGPNFRREERHNDRPATLHLNGNAPQPLAGTILRIV
jgi:hypothetical protein